MSERVVLLTLTALADLWQEEAETRLKHASRSAIFGPKMMILNAEANCIADCASQLREAIKVAQEESEHEGARGSILRGHVEPASTPDGGTV